MKQKSLDHYVALNFVETFVKHALLSLFTMLLRGFFWQRNRCNTIVESIFEQTFMQSKKTQVIHLTKTKNTKKKLENNFRNQQKH